MKSTLRNEKGILKIGRFLIPYRIYGKAVGQIVCVNGVQQSMAMWYSFVVRFSRAYRIVLFDYPGKGKAKIVSGPKQVSLNEQVEILLAVLDKTKTLPDATLCAASWGGVIAVALASKYPRRIKRLILASLGTKPNEKMVQTIKEGSGININNREQMAEVLIKSFGKDLSLKIKQKIVSQFRSMKEEDIRAFYDHGMLVISSKRLNELVDLKSIKAETILLNGEKDTIIDLEDVKFLSSQIPNCKMIILKNVGHFLHMEREEALDIYEEILSRG